LIMENNAILLLRLLKKLKLKKLKLKKLKKNLPPPLKLRRPRREKN